MQYRYRYEVVNHVDMIIAKNMKTKTTLRVLYSVQSTTSMMTEVWYRQERQNARREEGKNQRNNNKSNNNNNNRASINCTENGADRA